MGAGVVRRREPKRRAGVRGGRYARALGGGGGGRTVRRDLKTACTPSAVARSVRRSRCSSRSVSPSLARSDCTAGEPLSACVRSASRSVPAGGSGVDAVIPQLWRGVLTRGGGCRVANARGVGFLGCANRAIESTAARRLFRLASSASSASSAPAARTRSAGALLSPRQKRKKATTRACSKVHLTSSNRRS